MAAGDSNQQMFDPVVVEAVWCFNTSMKQE